MPYLVIVLDQVDSFQISLTVGTVLILLLSVIDAKIRETNVIKINHFQQVCLLKITILA
jgi:hypothetical protein